MRLRKLVIGYCLTALLLISRNGAKVIGTPTTAEKFAFILGLKRLGYSRLGYSLNRHCSRQWFGVLPCAPGGGVPGCFCACAGGARDSSCAGCGILTNFLRCMYMWLWQLDVPQAASCPRAVSSTPFLGLPCSQKSVGWVVSKFQRKDGHDITSSRKTTIYPCTANATVTVFIIHVLYTC